MRRGDLVLTQVLSTALIAVVGAALGLFVGSLLINNARNFLAQQSHYSASGEKVEYATGLETVFAPIGRFYLLILVASVLVSVISAIYPSVRAARTDPAKVLQS